MKSFLTVTLIALLLAPALFAEDRQLGLDFGVLMAQSEKPTLAYAVTKDWSLNGYLGPVFERIESSLLYSDRFTAESEEVYMLRGFTTHNFEYRGWYAGAGIGTWYLVNSNAGDVLYPAAKVGLGFKYQNYIDAHVFGELGRRGDLPDLYFCGAGVVIGW